LHQDRGKPNGPSPIRIPRCKRSPSRARSQGAGMVQFSGKAVRIVEKRCRCGPNSNGAMVVGLEKRPPWPTASAVRPRAELALIGQSQSQAPNCRRRQANHQARRTHIQWPIFAQLLPVLAVPDEVKSDVML
jgi:hypothetical protein